MIDHRESIMARLTEIAGEQVGTDNVWRNRIIVDDVKATRIFILEGDEEAAEEDPVGRAPQTPRRINMMPQMVIVWRAKADDIGSRLNEERSELISSVLNDSELAALTLNRRSVRYEGMETDLAFGRQMVGQMALRFRITCIMKPGSTLTA